MSTQTTRCLWPTPHRSCKRLGSFIPTHALPNRKKKKRHHANFKARTPATALILMTSNDTVRQLLTTVTNPQAPVVSIGSNLAHLRNIPAGILCHSEASPTNSTKCLIARPLSADESVLLSLIIFFQMGSNS